MFKNDLISSYQKSTNGTIPKTPKTLVSQIDEKAGTWKTTYDIINDSPFRLEPQGDYFSYIECK